MINEEDLIKIGKLGKPHGVDGEVAFVFTDDAFDQEGCDFIFLKIDGIQVPFYIEGYRFKSAAVAIVKLEGVDSIDDAKRLQGIEVWCDKSFAREEEAAPEPAEALTGYEIRDTNLGHIGTVTGIDAQTENVLLFGVDDKGGEIIIPLHDDLIASIDDGGRVITFDLPDGMIDLDKAEAITD